MEGLYSQLRPFVVPFREEGPPKLVWEYLLPGEEARLGPAARSILEMMTLGYRPATSLAILGVLNESSNMAIQGMELARALEKRFNAQEGWFTVGRHYEDRVKKVLLLLAKLGIINETSRIDGRARLTPAYHINPSLRDEVKLKLNALSNGERVSLFSAVRTKDAVVSVAPTREKYCTKCGNVTVSVTARFCEVCSSMLKTKCENCQNLVDAIYNYCPNCGKKID